MKKNRLIIGLIYLLLFVAVVLVIYVLKSVRYTEFLVLNNDGYTITNNEITKNLQNDNLDPADADYKATPFSISDIIYEKSNNYYIGEDKQPINKEYPLFVNNYTAILCLTDEGNLITDEFDYAQTYSGLYVNDGISFNPDMERAYREEFILLGLPNGLFINTKSISISGSFIVEESIPTNAIIRFMENEIRYYSLNGDVFQMYNIKPLLSNSIIKVNGKEYSYYDFLEKLGLYEKATLIEQEELRKEEEAVSTTPTPIVYDEDNTINKPDKDKKIPAKPEETSNETTNQNVPSRAEEDHKRDNRNNKDKKDTTSDTTQDSTPSKPNDMITITPIPPKAADLPEPAKPVEAVGAQPDIGGGDIPQIDIPEEEVPEEEIPVNPNWKKPVVTLGDFTSTVYTIQSAGMVIENSEYLYRTGVTFSIYENSKLIMRKAFVQSTDVVIGPLKPDTQFHVEVEMEYLNAQGRKLKEAIATADVKTRPLSELTPLRFNWTNGDLFPNKIQLANLTITNAIKGTSEKTDDNGNTKVEETYIETVLYMNRMEVIITSKEDESLTYTMLVSAKDLNALKTGKSVLYESNGRILSSTNYYYEFICYDRFGNILPLDGIVRGTTHTCKQPPRENITLLVNEVKNIEMKLSTDNPDNAMIVEGSTFFVIYDSEDNPVITTITRKGSDGQYSEITEQSEKHLLYPDGDTIKFLDLLDSSVYKIRIFCDYDIDDNHGIYQYANIGELLFTTMKISDLGFAFFKIEMKEVKDNSAVLSLTLDKMRTDKRLVALFTDMDVTFLHDETQDGTGISVTYKVDDGTPFGERPEVLPENNGTISLTTEEINLVKAQYRETDPLKTTFLFRLDNLKSNSKYKIIVTPKVQIGTVGNVIHREIKTICDPSAFTTMKKMPVIDIDSIYASANFIKLYGVTVNDPDGAVLTYPVTIQVYDEDGRQIYSHKINSADKVSVISVDKLEREKYYTFRFFAAEFNNGTDMTTYRRNYEIYYSPLAEKEEYLKIMTREAVSGSIQLLQLNQNKTTDIVEIKAKDMKSHNSKITLYQEKRFSSNSQKSCKYSLTVDFGDRPVNSIQLQYSFIGSTNYKLYTVDPATNPSATPIAELTVSNQTVNSETPRWTEIVYLNNGVTLTGQHTIYIEAASTGTAAINCLWGVRFQNTEQCAANHYYANMNTILEDARGELGDIPSYGVRIYCDGVWIDTRRHEWVKNTDGSFTMNMYQVAGDLSETLVDSKRFEGEERSINTDFFYEVEKYDEKMRYHTYRFVLYGYVAGYEILLDSDEFTTKEDIIYIKDEYDLANVRYAPSKKYYVINDIVYPVDTSNITGGASFSGELDFRGHTLTYNSVSNLIPTIGYTGTLKNMVFTFGEGWGEDKRRLFQRIVSNNYGHIQNIKVIYKNGNVDPGYLANSGVICNMNYSSGVIENFVIDYQDSYISTHYNGGVCSQNMGIIRNGYIYGEPMRRTPSEKLTEVQYNYVMYMGGIVGLNRTSGVVENVFSLIDLETREQLSNSDYAFGIVGLNDGTIRNSFTTGDVTYGGKIRMDYGPAYKNRFVSSVANNVFYYSEKNYGNTDNQSITKRVLYDKVWYDYLFNKSGSTKKGQYDLEPVDMGYYPHVVWPEFMPLQEYIPLPGISDADKVTILDTKVVEQGDDYAVAVITLHNPDKYKITNFEIQFLKAEIISQEEDGKFYRVKVRLTQAPVTKYYSSYEINSFTFTYGYYNQESIVKYPFGDGPTVAAEFYKPIRTVEDWATIKDDYKQNYRLYADLDFMYRAPSTVVISADVTNTTSGDAFLGKIDGNNHKISYMDTGEYGYVIGKLSGVVKNLTVEQLDLTKGTGLYKGFIGRMLEKSAVDNVHILGMEAISYQHCGSIAGDIYAATIMNSSAHDVNIVAKPDGNYTQFVGGIVGKHRISATNTIYGNMSIQNCYVDGLHMEILTAGDCGGAGGLVGYIRASAEIYHVYVINSTIETVYKNAGGLIGSVDTLTNSHANQYSLKDYYVDVDIYSITERCGGSIGYSLVENSEKEEYGLALGNVTSSLTLLDEELKPLPLQVGRFYGYSKYISESIYGYEYSLVNGEVNTTDELTTLLTYQQLTNPDSYDNMIGILKWDEDFAVNEEELAQGIMPKLKKAGSDELLKYQSDYYLENNAIKVTKVDHYEYPGYFEVIVETEHSPELNITGATFRGLEQAEGQEPVTILPTATGSVLKYKLQLEGYYDSYYLTSILYTMSGNPDVRSQSVYVNLQIPPQYMEISSSDEWNIKMAEHGQKRYNIRITGDLDFSPHGGNAVTGVLVNHMIGSTINKDNWKTISGINMVTDQPLVAAAFGNVNYLKFDNITLKKTSATPINSYGVFSAVTGEMHDLQFTNITIDGVGSSYIGITAQSYGMNYGITLSGISVRGTYSTVPTKRGAGGLIGRLSGSGGIYDVRARNIDTEGRGYVGGIVGIQEDGRYLWDIHVENTVVVSYNLSYNYAGGIVGYANDTSLGDMSGNMSVKRAVIYGSSYVGGIAGVGSMYGDKTKTGIEKDPYQASAQDVFVVGNTSYIGGIAGQGSVQRTEVRNSQVYGNNQIGGVTGNGHVYLASCTDSIISTVFDRDDGQSYNNVFQNAAGSKKQYYENLRDTTTDPQEKAVYGKAVTALNLLQTTTRWNSIPSSSRNRIGGISGRTIYVANAIVANCRIGSNGATAVGGIVGRTELSSYNISPYQITACGTQNCEIYGASDIGGIIGTHWRAKIESCYSNSIITATTENAGGIAGSVKATNLYSVSETPYANHLFFAGKVIGKTYVGGIIGRMNQDLFSVNEGWLMIGDVQVTSSSGVWNYFLNKYPGDSDRIYKSMVYEDSTVSIGANPAIKASKYYQDYPTLLLYDQISIVNSSELRTKDTYVNDDKLNWSAETESYSVRYWNYAGLNNGFMPYLSHAPTNNYDLDSSIKIMKYQEGYVPDPVTGKAVMDPATGLYQYKYETYDGGIPIPGSGNAIVTRALMRARPVAESVPRAEFYTVDADKLNIEFSDINPDATVYITADGVVVAESKITKRTITLNYNFRSELEIKVTDGTDELTYNVWPEDVCRNVMTWNNDYYYVATNVIKGSKADINGQYLNMYAGHAIDIYGNVIDVESGQKIRQVSEISIAQETQPAFKFNYEGFSIETYKSYSLVNDLNRDKLRLYVKNGELSAISSNLPVTLDSIILDQYNGSSYCTVLTNEGVIVDMTASKINMPKDFDNVNIQYMTHNINSTNHILLVRYYDGAVAGFNYITGEKLDIDSPRGTETQFTVENGLDRRSKNTSMANFADAYMDVVEFKTNLQDIGWAEVNGPNVEGGDAVSSADARMNKNISASMFVEDTFVMQDGTTAGDLSGESNNPNEVENGGDEYEAEIEGNGNVEGAYQEEELQNSSVDGEKTAAGSLTLPEQTSINASGTNGYDVNGNLAILEDVASLQTAIDSIAQNGTTQQNLNQIASAISSMDGKGLEASTIAELKSDLFASVKAYNDRMNGDGNMLVITDEMFHQANNTPFGNTNLTGLPDTMQSNMNDKQQNDKENAIVGKNGNDETGINEDKLPQRTQKKPDKDEDATVDSDSTVHSNNDTTSTYIPVYDMEKSKYVIYDERDLLTKEDNELESMNDKVEKAGHMIDYRSKQKADIQNPGDENLYGYILLSGTVLGIAFLLSVLILRKRKEETL